MAVIPCPECSTPIDTSRPERDGAYRCAGCGFSLTPIDSPEPAGAAPATAAVASQDSALSEEWEIEEELGRGGMGVVYRARHRLTDERFAVKSVIGEHAADEAYLGRFVREVKILLSLHHPRVVRLAHSGICRGRPWLALELVSGPTLREAMGGRPMEWTRAIALGAQIAEALAYTHGQGVVHRDLKPENVLLDSSTGVRVTDFGLANLARPEGADSTVHRLTRLGTALGTYEYMAPEQRADAAHAGPAADLFSLGVMLFEMLTGRLPHGSEHPGDTVADLPAELDELVIRLLARSPADRPQSAGEVQATLSKLAAVAPGVPRVASPDASSAAPPGESPWLQFLFMALVAGALYVIGAPSGRQAALVPIRLGAQPEPQARAVGPASSRTQGSQEDPAKGVVARGLVPRSPSGFQPVAGRQGPRHDTEAETRSEDLPQQRTRPEIPAGVRPASPPAPTREASQPGPPVAQPVPVPSQVPPAARVQPRAPQPSAASPSKVVAPDDGRSLAERVFLPKEDLLGPIPAESVLERAARELDVDSRLGKTAATSNRPAPAAPPPAPPRPSAEALARQALDQGYALLAKKRLDDALAKARRAIELKPDLGHAHTLVGEVLSKRGRWHEALRAFQTSLRCGFDHQNVHFNLGVCQAWLGNWRAALDPLKTAIARVPTWTEAHVMLAACLFNLHQYKSALRSADRALTLERRHKKAMELHNLCMARLRAGATPRR